MQYSEQEITAFIDEFKARQKAEHGYELSDAEALELLTGARDVHNQVIAVLAAKISAAKISEEFYGMARCNKPLYPCGEF